MLMLLIRFMLRVQNLIAKSTLPNNLTVDNAVGASEATQNSPVIFDELACQCEASLWSCGGSLVAGVRHEP